MKQYLDLLKKILIDGEDRYDRTGTGTRSLFGASLDFDLSAGFPLLTTKKIYTKAVIEELLWFLRGSTNNNELNERGVTIWDEWATEDGSLGPIYGAEWRNWGGQHDQIKTLIDGIKNNPWSRRHIVSAWNVEDLPDETMSPQDNVKAGKMALAPCHLLFQFYVHSDNTLSCHMYQRSADYFLGVPFNIASYALLTHIIAAASGKGVASLRISFGDVHVYKNHRTNDIVYKQLDREPRPLPTLIIDPIRKNFEEYELGDFHIIGYDPHPTIRAPISV